MKEAKLISGQAEIEGSVAYVEQEPFIFSASIKDNILFGKEWDEDLFQKAIEVACLDHDIQEF
jgi:ATP-binding cassette, subfamily C (CFTR/MRP), member 4